MYLEQFLKKRIISYNSRDEFLGRYSHIEKYDTLVKENNSFDIRYLMDRLIAKYPHDEYKQDDYLGEFLREKLTPEGFIKDGICMCAAFIVCMAFLGYGLGNFEKFPNPSSDRYIDFSRYAYALFAAETSSTIEFDLPRNDPETHRVYRRRLSEFISNKISEGYPAMISVNNASHWMSALKYNNRIWFIDSLLGYGFNFYHTIGLKPKKIIWGEKVPEEDSMGPVFLPPEYYENESKANWWIASLTNNICALTPRLKDNKYYKTM